MSDLSFRVRRVPVHVHRARERSLYERGHLHVLEILLVDVASVVLQYIVLHRLDVAKKKEIDSEYRREAIPKCDFLTQGA